MLRLSCLEIGGWCLVGRRLMTDDTVRGHSGLGLSCLEIWGLVFGG